jgi:hypothetical protein
VVARLCYLQVGQKRAREPDSDNLLEDGAPRKKVRGVQRVVLTGLISHSLQLTFSRKQHHDEQGSCSSDWDERHAVVVLQE